METKRMSLLDIVRLVALAVFFIGCEVIGYLIFAENKALPSKSEAQQLLYPLGLGVLLSGLVTATLSLVMNDKAKEDRPVWWYPALAGLLTFCGLGIAYIFLGIWPVGGKSCMLVDMHHQYAPLLSKLREMLLGGENLFYSFELGMGASVLPAFAYYLASPLNLLLTLFPERLLTEGIFLITMIKNVLIAVGCAVCLQYVYRRRTPLVAVISLMYAMMMYVLAYSWNIMWLDGVMALPLVVLGFEHLMRRGKYLPYVLSLAYALYANYYIAFMLCMFLVLYYFAYLLRDNRDRALNRQSLWRFTLGSLLGGGLSMFLVLPVYMALGQTSAAGAALPDMNAYFDMFNLLGRHLYAVSPTIRSANLPNVYCGVAVMLLVPLFALNAGIPRRRRLAYLGLFGVLSLSLVVNQVNLLWHGLHSPNDLPYRFSFIYCFVLLLLSYETLVKIRHVRPRQVVTALACVVAYLMLEERFGDAGYEFISIYVTLLFLLVYAVILLFMIRRTAFKRVACMLLLTVVTLELTLNASRTFITLNNNEHYTGHESYVDNLNTESIRMAVGVMNAQVEKQTDGAFARAEFLPRRTCMDTALFNYAGITSFASSNSYRTTRLMGAMGYAVNGVNSYMYKSFSPMTDSLLGIRYVTINNEISNHAQLKLLDSVTATDEQGGSNTYYVYENTAALPLAFRGGSATKTWASSYYNPADTVNSLYAALTGDQTPVLVAMPIAEAHDSEGTLDIRSNSAFYYQPTGSQTARFTATADVAGQYFLFADCRAAKSINAVQGGNSWSITTHEPYFIDLGTLQAGDTATVSITNDGACSGNVFVLRLDETVFNNAMAKLAADGLTVTKFTDTHITGTVNASADGVMFTSIPYDAGWTVTVDGKKVETYGLDTASPNQEESDGTGAALLGFDIPAGEHTVEFTFRTRGFVPGVLLSVVSLVLLIAVVLFTGRRASALAGTRLAWAVDTSDLDPDTTYALPLPIAEETETDEAAETEETVEEPQEEGTENA